jgi:hypothetical protein
MEPGMIEHYGVKNVGKFIPSSKKKERKGKKRKILLFVALMVQ